MRKWLAGFYARATGRAENYADVVTDADARSYAAPVIRRNAEYRALAYNSTSVRCDSARPCFVG